MRKIVPPITLLNSTPTEHRLFLQIQWPELWWYDELQGKQSDAPIWDVKRILKLWDVYTGRIPPRPLERRLNTYSSHRQTRDGVSRVFSITGWILIGITVFVSFKLRYFSG